MARQIQRLRAEEPWLSRNVDSWKEDVTAQVNENTSRITTSFVGLYDQVADVTNPGGVPLDAASNYSPGDFYTLSAVGVFSTALPELNGLSGGPGDRIIAASMGVWVLLKYSDAFLSSVSDDTAAGIITHQQAPKSNVAAAVGVDLMRKAESDAGDAAVQGNLNTHIGQSASADDVHGTKTYADAGDAAVQANLDAHTGNALIHFDDVPVDGVTYSRRDQAWVAAAPSFAYMSGGDIVGPWNATLKTITGYSGSGATPDMAAFVDESAGYIEIPVTGVWEVQATVTGDQGNNTKEEAMRLWVQYRNGPSGNIDLTLDVFDVATDKTTNRAFAFSYKRPLQAGDRVYLAVNATASMGTFLFEVTSLEVTRII